MSTEFVKGTRESIAFETEGEEKFLRVRWLPEVRVAVVHREALVKIETRALDSKFIGGVLAAVRAMEAGEEIHRFGPQRSGRDRDGFSLRACEDGLFEIGLHCEYASEWVKLTRDGLKLFGVVLKALRGRLE